MVTTPSVPGYRITKVLGVVTGLTPRTRGVGGKFIAGIQSAFGGDVSAYTTSNVIIKNTQKSTELKIL
ncbi:MAG: heavy metal-binding domain-containing protein [Candidatus Methylarchaceae archaeon HK01M]|nr:heavy metal-binding domain-containing protein [Candidatus Methylarchaceae archaeon HK01M]